MPKMTNNRSLLNESINRWIENRVDAKLFFELVQLRLHLPLPSAVQQSLAKRLASILKETPMRRFG